MVDLNSGKYVKYPRTVHLPWSEGADEDDIVIDTTEAFQGRTVVVTEKMDGENTTFYDNYIHHRSLNSGYHPSRTVVKGLHAKVGYKLESDERVCGENLYWAKSVVYTELPAYFLVFNIWKGDTCLSWDDTVERATELGLHTVPVLYRGEYDEEAIKALYDSTNTNQYNTCEGYVVRWDCEFSAEDFTKACAKFVRPDHIKDRLDANGKPVHWMTLRTPGDLNMLKVSRKR
jgi:hypothetical protein